MEVEDMEIDDISKEEDDYEEEEFLVYIDIDPTLLAEKQIREATDVKIFGMDTKKPLLRVNNLFFEGNKASPPSNQWY